MSNKDLIEQAMPYIGKFNDKSITLDEFKIAVRIKFFRLCTLYHIKDADGKKVRFTPNLAQVEFYKASRPKDIILKARQLGFTTWKMIFDLDDCLFKKNYSAGCIAHNDKAAKDIFRSKIKFAYESIKPSSIKILEKIGFALPTPSTDKNGMYVFSNGSSIGVSTGYRGDTIQSLHISELGKISKKYPDRAEEIKTGAFPAASGKDSTITIESTAEGRSGDFFDYCEVARGILKLGNKPHKKQFMFHFFPWWKDPKYSDDSGDVNIPDVLIQYFSDLSGKHDVNLTDGQKSWYYFTWADQGDKMRQEFPSIPEEAFENSIQGAYYQKQFTQIYKDGRICDGFNNDAKVNTAWDIGVGDNTSIWFYQKIGKEIHLIDYYENSGEGLEHYANVIKDKGYDYGRHYAPHDIDNRDFSGKGKTRREMAREGFTINGQVYRLIFDKVAKLSIEDGINYARKMLERCVFDSVKCERGIKCLESYRKQWNDKLGCYRDKPLHDFASDAADAFRYLAVTEEGCRAPMTKSMKMSR